MENPVFDDKAELHKQHLPKWVTGVSRNCGFSQPSGTWVPDAADLFPPAASHLSDSPREAKWRGICWVPSNTCRWQAMWATTGIHCYTRIWAQPRSCRLMWIPTSSALEYVALVFSVAVVFSMSTNGTPRAYQLLVLKLRVSDSVSLGCGPRNMWF